MFYYCLQVGTPICIPQREFIDIGRIASIENNHKPVDSAKKGQKIAIKVTLFVIYWCLHRCCYNPHEFFYNIFKSQVWKEEAWVVEDGNIDQVDVWVSVTMMQFYYKDLGFRNTRIPF